MLEQLEGPACRGLAGRWSHATWHSPPRPHLPPPPATGLLSVFVAAAGDSWAVAVLPPAPLQVAWWRSGRGACCWTSPAGQACEIELSQDWWCKTSSAVCAESMKHSALTLATFSSREVSSEDSLPFSVAIDFDSCVAAVAVG